jgi:ABC-type transport system involved in multi-copper enzyme maturation permease subunit
VNPTIFVTTLRQRFASRTRLLLVAIVFLFPLGFSFLASEAAFQATRTGAVFAFLLGAGILGQESASGVFQLLFARPVRRWEYVVSRWLALCAASCALVIVQIGILTLLLASKGLPDSRDILTLVADQMLSAIGTASVILFFSSFLSGVGDVLGVVLTAISAQVISGIGQLRQSEVLSRIGAEIARFVSPQLSTAALSGAGGVPWVDVVSYLSTVALCLAVAVGMLNRREISYASD